MIDTQRLLPPSLPRTAFGENARAGAGTQPAEQDFASVLAGFARHTVETMRAGEQAAVEGIMGSAPIQEVVDKVMAAEQALQAGMAIREKVVSAVLELSRMTI